MEPNATDVAAVNAFMTGQPAPAPAPQPTAPAPVAPQAPAPNPYYQPGIGSAPQPAPAPAPVAPAPVAPAPPAPNYDPFAGIGTEVSAPQPAAQPTAPAPVQPSPTSQGAVAPQFDPNTGQPIPPAAPVAPAAPTFQQTVEQVLATIPEAPKSPDITSVENPDDPAAVQKFFQDYAQSIVAQVEAGNQRKTAVQNLEAKAWGEAFTAYPSLEKNPELRSTIQAIRMGNYESSGVYQSPTEAAKVLIDAMQGQYQKGVVDNQVQTTITQTQPMNGGGQVPTTGLPDANQELLAVQDGGEVALAQVLANRINNGLM